MTLQRPDGRAEKLAAEAERERKKKRAAEIVADFEERRERRRSIESGWLLNMNFFSGKQYCDVSATGELVEEDKRFYWQSRRVFNHIAPTVDSRLAKLTRLRPAVKVRAFSDEDGDLKAAKLANGVLEYVKDRIGFNDTVAKATLWSEVCGSAFYKIVWDERGGRQVATAEDGTPVYEGEVNVSAVSPFEIYPDRLDADGLEDLRSVMQARIVPVSRIYETFGIRVEGKSAEAFSSPSYSSPSGGNTYAFSETAKGTIGENSELLIERYEVPSEEHVRGRYEVVAGGELLYEGELPYKNGAKDCRGFPFVKQDSLNLPGAFFGCGVVDRLIPVQRAYNAVRNRKHELMNRIALGVVAVEDGSLDCDELADEGLSPGKVLVYRQGAKTPELLDCGDVSKEFAVEEEWLEREFGLISGVSELSKNSMPSQVTSASGLRLLLNEDNARLSVTTDNICTAVKALSAQIIHLYRQFAGSARLMTMTGEDKRTEVYYFNARELSSSDILFDTEEATTPEERRETIMTLFNAGIFSDEEGKVSTENKLKILEAFGYGTYENARDIASLHIAKAARENVEMQRENVRADEYDDHALHIREHTRFLLGSEFDKKRTTELKERFCRHLKEHEEAEKRKKASQKEEV